MLRHGVQIGKKKKRTGNARKAWSSALPLPIAKPSSRDPSGRKSKTFYENFTLLCQTYNLYSKQRFIAEMRKGVYMLNVLVVCEESQAVCKAFRELGHNAFSLDIQECSGGHPEWHIKRDAIEFLEYCKDKIYLCFSTQDNLYHVQSDWDLIIAHPPCTYLTKTSAPSLFPNKRLNEDRYKRLLEARDFFMYLYDYPVKHLAVENPIPLKIANLPKASQEVNPCDFGANFSKRTYLWLRNLPPLISTSICLNPLPHVMVRGNGSKNRSKTYPGLADAMASQWGVICDV